MAIRIQLRRDTAANWTSSNPVLRAGELGIETDTLKFKIGNGSSTWTQITNYANVTSTGLSNSLNDYILAADQGTPGGPAELNSDGEILVPEDTIILWNDAEYTYTTKVVATQPTANRIITLPDATGTVALTSQLPTQYTDELAQDAAAAALAAGTHTNITVTYNDNANSISLAAAPGYVDEQAVDAVAAALAAGTHTNISVSYNDEANSISLTGATTYSDENAQDAVGNAVGTGLSYNDSTGAISVDTTTIQARVADVSDTEIGYLNGVTSAIQTQLNDKAPINNPTFTGTVTLPGNPSTANEAATKAYVDNITAGLNFHAAVHVATTTDLSATYNNGAGTLSASGTFPTIDGETIVETQRVLVKSQTDAKQNGIYELTDDGDPSGTWVLTRTADADNTPTGEIAYGDFVFVQTGSTNGGYGFTMTTTGTITLGTSNINWTQFNAGQSVTAGNGLSEPTAGTLAIDTAITADLSTAQTLTNKTITGTFTGNLTGNADTVTNGVYTNAANTITAASASTKPLILKGAASQSANLLEFHNSSGTPLTFFNSSGGITATEGVISTAYSGGKLTTGTLGYLNATTFNASVSPVIVRGAVSQSANLTEWQNSSGGVDTAVTSTGRLSVRTTLADAGLNVGAPSAATVGVIVRGVASQTANLTQWQDSAGTVKAFVRSDGFIRADANLQTPTIYGTSATSGTQANIATAWTFVTNVATNVGIIIKGAASQTANLQEWQNSSGTVLASVASTGQINADAGIYAGFSTIGTSRIGTAHLSVASQYFNNPVAVVQGISGQSATVLTVKAGASQSANLQEWQNSSGTVLASVNASGQFVGDGSQLTGLTTALTTPSTVTLTANTATTVDTTALSAFTSLEYMVSIKQGSKVRTSKLVVQTDGTSVDMTEFAITETGGTISGVVVSAAVSGTDAVLQATVTDAATTNATVKLAKIKL